jgi:chemotaxis protein methyltransferase CheR
LEQDLGLELKDRDRRRIAAGIGARMASLGLTSDRQYPARLDSAELAALTRFATVGESWFCRDPGQMRLLRHLLLPRLIAARRGERRLRLWSAGCAGGQEALSLAMLVLETVPTPDDWDLCILGTDIDPAALAVAEAGYYEGWALRGLDSRRRQRFFRADGAGWRTGPALRRHVRFRLDNLVADASPPITRVDLVLCRNVLIYLQRDRLGRVLDRFAGALRPAGLMMVGHCELLDVESRGFDIERFPESLVYRRQGPAPLPIARPAEAPPPGSLRPASRSKHATADAAPMGRAAPGPGPVAVTDPDRAPADIPGPTPPSADAPPPSMLADAEACAAAGDYPRATEQARTAACAAPLDHRPVYLLAQLAELEGRHAEALGHLKHVLYLAPEHLPAYLDAAVLHERLGEPERARRHRQAARRLLDACTVDAPLPAPYHHLTAGQLRDYLDSLSVGNGKP